MKILIIKAELSFDEEMMYCNELEKGWFYEDVLEGKLELFSEEIGDMVGSIKIIEIESQKD
jgi:hypothetical protein